MPLSSLTIGMACYDDFDGVYFTVQALRLYHADAFSEGGCELLVVDNHPGSPTGEALKNLMENWAGGRYVPAGEVVGTSAPRDRIFEEARSETVLCIDSHVLLPRGTLLALRRWYAENPDSQDLLSGPMLYDNLSAVVTHFDDVWRAEMWGIWGDDPRGHDPEGDPFEIPAMGLGLFTCRKDAWLGFNEYARGFGGEEHYIHEKFRQAGRKCLCLPFLRWLHRFGRPAGVEYPLTRWNKVRNYVLEHQELGLPLDRVHKHFVLGEPEPLPDGTLAQGPLSRMPEGEWEYLLEDPIGHVQPPSSQGGCGSCPDGVGSLDELYEKAASEPSDINEHVPKLRELASQCDHVTEFGMRHGVSTVALLAGQPKRLVTYDRAQDGMSSVLKKHQGATDFEFRQGDVLGEDVDIEETDLLFIDTKHTAEQLSAELDRHAGKVRRWIALHDTQIFGLIGEGGGPGLLVALRAFLKEHPEWSVVYHVRNNYGLTVVSRDADEKPPLPSLGQRFLNFTKHSAEHLMDGGADVDEETFERRLDVCALCDQRNDQHCSVCGCPILKKASWRSSHCDLGKWPPSDEPSTREEEADARE